ncbi:MAG TPA: hypothetical protein ENI34_03700 [candidate division WOR-3 bacterium]|uniref:DUF6754 domain-containing protein n=1 Tax=candidate division WOR-3 bacterium TaxID=2052148 RepID=A0A9C9EMS0_UNCW3|nr:hypothetical protein [candidate division WOR-3 bacterium]
MVLLILLLAQGINIEAYDTPNDDGSSITIQWQSELKFDSLILLRSLEPTENYEVIQVLGADASQYVDTNIERGKEYYYKVEVKTGDENLFSNNAGPVKASAQFFNTGRINILITIVVLFAAVLIYIARARREKLYIRRIPALTAAEEAIGRATEMGKPVLYVPGIMDIDDPQTIASMSILSKVAEKTAEYGTPLYVPTSKAMAMTMAQQVVKEAATKVGRPDWFNADNIRYLTDDQFGYVSAVDGIMLREKPATNFYLGTFYAESLILAETGHSTGAIQIAGTAMPDQLPFFVAACDYTLLGEELYAASAYLSQEPVQLGSLKGQDLGKLIFILVIIAGVITRLFGTDVFTNLFTTVQ